MITKFQSIKNLAVFHDFVWDTSVLDSQGKVLPFKQVNVIYGRNYSGKTTLSRIMRAFETGTMSDKYGSYSFAIETDSGLLTEKDYKQKPLLMRVFNDDFIRDNLGFVMDPSGQIAPFAVLGEDNEKIEAKIRVILDELGSDAEGERTGLYAAKASAYKSYSDVKKKHTEAQDDLDKKKNKKATDRTVGIKYKSDRFGNQNYNIRNLENDIAVVLANDYVPLNPEQIKTYENHLTEKSMGKPREIKMPRLAIADIASTVSELCGRSINSSNKIQELMNDIVLQTWVKQGMERNAGRKRCAFCGQPLTDERWQELFSHFDEESEKLNKELLSAQDAIKIEKQLIVNAFAPNKAEFYSEYSTQLDALIVQYKVECDKYIAALDILFQLVNARLESLHKPVEYSFCEPNCAFDEIFSGYATLREESIAHAAGISTRKSEAQKQLRLAEVYEFVVTTGYSDALSNIQTLATEECAAEEIFKQAEETVKQKNAEISALRRQQNDEEKGAIKVNEYLRTFFGHRYLSLVAKTQGEDEGKQIYFEIERNGEKAFHLSEGEKSLIAFCYFVAKLDDVDTHGKCPIIWIDDPISSLDSNHIYFVYSLITQKILARDCYEQLFITTHNLQFLKYLRILSINNHVKGEKGVSRNNFLVERKGNQSVLKVMPAYLKNHGTEFNHWFSCIYQCANQEEVTDENIHLFEGFGNNARKFFETYLYYRYPDKKDFNTHLKRFFGECEIPQILVRKLSDEQSHADGDLENHDLPFEEPEIISAAKQILDRLEAIDKEQYDALVESIK